MVLRFDPPQPTEILIPAYNEEEGIGATITEVLENLCPQRILVIDGHSHDRTVEVAKDLGAHIVFQDGKGKGDAIAKAIGCISSNTKYVALMDADYTYPAEYLPLMIQILEVFPWIGMVCGNRYYKKPKGAAFKRRFYYGNKLLAFAHSFLNGVELEDPLTGLRVIRAEILKDCHIISKGFDLEVELNSFVNKQGFEALEIPIEYRERLGEKKLKMKDGATILGRIIRESFL